MAPSILLGALAMGLFGSAHCVAMCGGVSAALSGGIDATLRKRPPVHVAYVALYNVGRIASYAASGALFGVLSLGLRREIAGAQAALRIVAGILTLGLGLYLAGLLPSFARIERAGAPVWARVAPLGKRLLPVRSPGHALVLGALWGWVPCGMVYTALALATTADGPLESAGVMTAFGLGTLPAMIAMGTIAGQALAGMGRAWVRRAAGIALALMAVTSLAFASVGHVGMGHASHAGTCGGERGHLHVSALESVSK